MTKNQLLALAAFITSLANEGSNDLTENPPASEPTKGKRGRPPASATPPAEQTPPAEEPAVTGKTYEELQAIIRPVVEAGQGVDVKKVIKKYAPETGALKELATLPQHHATFEKDIAALSY